MSVKKRHSDADGDTSTDLRFRKTPRAAVEPSGPLPRFQGSGADQTHGVHGSPLQRMRMRMRQAFTPSQPVFNPSMFAGRNEVLTALIRAIEDQRLHVVTYGERGIGKTSLMHILSRLAREARYVVRYASCGEETEFSDMFRAIVRDIPLLYHADFAPTSDASEEGRSLADLLPEGTFNVPQLTDVLAKISGTHVLLILDEFDRAHSPAFRRSIAELIKNLSDRSARVQLVIAGVAGNLTELIEHIPSIRRNIMGLQVPNMTQGEIEQLVHNAETVCGMKFTDEEIGFINLVSYGSPYIANLIGQHAGLNAIDRGDTVVAVKDIILAVHQAVEEIRHRVTAKSVHFVTEAETFVPSDTLGLLARSALYNGGRLDIARLEGLLRDLGGSEAFLRNLSEKTGLVGPIPYDPAGAYSFNEEGVPVYLWMRQMARWLDSASPNLQSLQRSISQCD
ncbi:ATP-binding protein [Sphingobium sufflavum]|uniref:ATP-binding protein n=1 Tax=Sphingobium sufflavum TaxID=1129547 RepID=UPI001F345B38|nr:ATP-binding protein [Sphingobium sufflavum]MCE7798519.1 ATP-binding protein [Sphingobium sufflavum]